MHGAQHNEKSGSVHALEAANFFIADVQTGLGPYVAVYLASAGWTGDRVGWVLTIGSGMAVLLQSPAGWIVDRVPNKRAILLLGIGVLAAGAMLLASATRPATVYPAQLLIGSVGPFLLPTLTAITMGLVGLRLFDRQFGKNQGFNSAGNLFAALLMALVSHFCGNRAIFVAAAVLTIPTLLSTLRIRQEDIDPTLATGVENAQQTEQRRSSIGDLLRDRTLLFFLLCAFLFHLANAAMLPELGEMLARGSARTAAPFMSGCIAITQATIMVTAASIGTYANHHGRKSLLMVGFAVLPIRAVLYTVLHSVPALLTVQLLDGVANAIFGVVSILVIADLTRGTGRFNLGQGAMATAVGLGASLSTAVGGKLIKHGDFRLSFLALGAVACVAVLCLILLVPETRVPAVAPQSAQT